MNSYSLSILALKPTNRTFSEKVRVSLLHGGIIYDPRDMTYIHSLVLERPDINQVLKQDLNFYVEIHTKSGLLAEISLEKQGIDLVKHFGQHCWNRHHQFWNPINALYGELNMLETTFIIGPPQGSPLPSSLF